MQRTFSPKSGVRIAPQNSSSFGASTVELAIFFTLVAAILASVTLFLTGTLPQMYASARLTNTLEGATLVKPRLGALTLHAAHSSSIGISEPPPNVPSLALADNQRDFPALSLETKALGDFLELAFPAEHANPLSCIAVYAVKAHECEFSSASEVELVLYADCPDGTQLQCIVAQANAILQAKGCDKKEAAPVLLAALYPREGGFLKSPCAVTEIGYPRVIEH